MTKGSSFSETRAGAPFTGRLECEDTAPSRNPELALGSRFCDATDEGGSFAGGMADDLRVAWLCVIRKFQTFTGGCGRVIGSEVDEG